MRTSNDIAVVMDCGSTNVTVSAVDTRGAVLKSTSYPNASASQPGGEEGWRIWDLDQIWWKLCDACRQVCSKVERYRIKAVTVATMGADGAPVHRDGTLAYPAICWQDTRTERLARDIAKWMDPWDIFAETGYQVISFNTLLRLMWLRQHAPRALDEADCWLMMPGLFSLKLCGELSIDPTSSGTMMAMALRNRDWSPKMLSLAGVDASFFPPWAEPGTAIGCVRPEASEQTGLPGGIPVVATGHDTQFAAVGSAASPKEAILSSGTWEILMLRLDRFGPNRFGFEEGLLFECDAVAGLWNPQLLMMGSGALEWVRQNFYADLRDRQDAYAQMVADARKVPHGAEGVMVLPSFVAGTGPARKYNTHGSILGLSISTNRGQVYRAALEGLSFQLRHALQILTRATGFQARGVRVVGGGSKNDLWNQIRADVTGLPVSTIAQKEATVLGAALFAFLGADVFTSLEEAQIHVAMEETVFEPSERRTLYEERFARYLQALDDLKEFYQHELRFKEREER